jgi:nitrogen fixation protein FixH
MNSAKKSWSYYTWPTFIICIFLATAALNITSFTLAKKTYDKPFSEKAWDESLVYEKIVSQKRNALLYNLSAEYTLEENSNHQKVLTVTIVSQNKEFIFPKTISVIALRPADSSKDKTIVMNLIDNGRYQAGSDESWLKGLWYFKLTGEDFNGQAFRLENQVNLK